VGHNSDTTFNYFALGFYGQRSPGWILGRGKILFFCFSKRLCRLRGPPSLLFGGYGVSFLGVKWPGREANHTHPFNAKSKMSGPLPVLLYISMAWKGKTVPFFMGENLGLFYEGTLSPHSVALSSITGWKLWHKKGFMICCCLIRIRKTRGRMWPEQMRVVK